MAHTSREVPETVSSDAVLVGFEQRINLLCWRKEQEASLRFNADEKICKE